MAKNRRVKINADKSAHVALTLRKGDCPCININREPTLNTDNIKYLRYTYIVNTKVKELYFILGLKLRSKLSLTNKVMPYKAIIKPL